MNFIIIKIIIIVIDYGLGMCHKYVSFDKMESLNQAALKIMKGGVHT